MNKELLALSIIAGISVLFVLMTLVDRKSRKRRDQALQELRQFVRLAGFVPLDPLDRSLEPLVDSVAHFGQVVRAQEAFVSNNTGRIIARVTCAGRHADSFFSDLVIGAPAFSGIPDFTLLHLPRLSGLPRMYLDRFLNMTHFSRLTPREAAWNAAGSFTLYCEDHSRINGFLSEDRLRRLSAKSGCILIAEKGYIFIRLLGPVQPGKPREQEAKQLLEIAGILSGA